MIIIVALIVTVLDQWTKFLILSSNIRTNGDVHLIGNFLRLTYLENSGAAFGILKNAQIFFCVLTVIIMLIISVIIFKYHKNMDMMSKVLMGLFIGGMLGNFIDRLRFGYVIDFIHLRFFNKWDFAVFNIADMAISITAVLVIVFVMLGKWDLEKLDW